MAERPSFQFYPGAWRNNAKLRRCSHAARAVWVDILCILHDSDEYGVLRWPLADIANAAGAPLELVRELVDKEVLKGRDSGDVLHCHLPRVGNRVQPTVTLVHSADGPCWYSSRMVLDEWRRKTKGASTRFVEGGNRPRLPSQVPSQRQGNGSSSSSSSSVSSSATGEGGQETANQLATLSAILGMPQNDFNKQASNLIVLSQLKAEGCDFSADILPAAQRAAKGGRLIQSLRYIVAAAHESRDGRKALSSLPAPFDPTSEAGWRDRLRVWAARNDWHPKWGPDPNQPDCKCPSEVLADFRKAAA